ncbi:MAG TPA: hypothetical protein VHY58_20540 [Streptosporangiaceae bacterium]|nr:hypothetical protein [Streptosporangiaceae bacterium]
MRMTSRLASLAAGVPVLAAVVGAAAGAPASAHPKAAGKTSATATVYVAVSIGGVTSAVRPVSPATNKPGTPIKTSTTQALVSTPNGKTVYAANAGANTVGPPISLEPNAKEPVSMAMTPNGATLYVTSEIGGVTPIDTATNTAGTLITSTWHGYTEITRQIVITPNGKTAYVVGQLNGTLNRRRNVLSPIATATDKPGAAITVGRGVSAITITP